MITLLTLTLLWGLISTYRLHKECKKNNISFNPLEKTFLDFLGFIFSFAILITLIIYLCVNFMP
jgi:hypothetical protein